MPRTRAYPQLNLIKDDAAATSLQLLWDRFYDALDTIDAQQATLAAQELALAEQGVRLTTLQVQTEIGSLLASTPADAAADSGFGGFGGGGSGGSGTPPGSGGGGGDTPIPGQDGGEGSAGLVQAGPTGHLDPPFPLNPFTMGRIVGGVGNEFPALLAPAVDQPTRTANLQTLLGRVIWHLQRAGFNAGKQRNPSLAISPDKITCQNQVNGIWLVYDIFPGAAQDNFNNQFNLQMVQTAPANTVADGGIPD